jgi:hypothetical protein
LSVDSIHSVHLSIRSEIILIRSAFLVIDCSEFVRFQSQLIGKTNGAHHAKRVVGVR